MAMPMPPEETATTQESSRRQTILGVEVLVVLLFAYSTSFFAQFLTSTRSSHGVLLPAYDFAAEIGRLAPLLLIVWVADGSFEVLGIKKPVWVPDLLMGAVFTAFLVALLLIPKYFLPHDLY